MTKQRKAWKGHCPLLCGRSISNSATKNTSAWKHLRKLGIKRRPKNRGID